MKTISVTEFKAHCLELIGQVSNTGECVLLTKRGRPTAMIGPPPVAEARSWVPGRYDDKIKIVGDIIAPIEDEWEALA